MPDSVAQQLATTLSARLTPPEIPPTAAAALRRALASVDQPFRLIIDDAHLLMESELSLQLLAALPDALPEPWKCIVVSRCPVTRDGERIFSASQCLFIDNELLAFTRDHIIRLYDELFGAQLSHAQAQQLLRRS